MNGRLVHVRSLTPDDETAWRSLAGRAMEPNPLYEPDCLIPAARHQQFGDEIYLAIGEEDGRVFGCIPIRAVNRWHGFPYPFVTTQVRRMLYCGTPLVDGERGTEAMAAIFAALAANRQVLRGRVLVLQELTQGGAVDDTLAQAAGLVHRHLYRYESWERGILVRRPDGDYDALRNRKFKKEVRRCRRRLGELLGSEPEIVDRSADPAAIEEYIHLEAAGYKAGARVAMATVPGEPEYFREMCSRFASRTASGSTPWRPGVRPWPCKWWSGAVRGTSVSRSATTSGTPGTPPVSSSTWRPSSASTTPATPSGSTPAPHPGTRSS